MMTHVVGQMGGVSPLSAARFRGCAPSCTEISASPSDGSGAHTGEDPILPAAF